MIGTRTSSSYTPHVDVAPADRPLILVAPRWEEAKPFLSETLSPNEEIASVFVDAILAAGGLPLQMSITEDIEVIDRKSTRLNSSHANESRMPSSA